MGALVEGNVFGLFHHQTSIKKDNIGYGSLHIIIQKGKIQSTIYADESYLSKVANSITYIGG